MQAQHRGPRPNLADAATFQIQRHRIARDKRHALRPEACDALLVGCPLLTLLRFALGGCCSHLPRQGDALRSAQGVSIDSRPRLVDSLSVAPEHATAAVIEQLAPAGRIVAPFASGKAMQTAGIDGLRGIAKRVEYRLDRRRHE